MEGETGGPRRAASASRAVSARQVGPPRAGRRWPRPAVLVAACVMASAVATPPAAGVSASPTPGATVSTVIGGTGVGSGTTIAQDPVSVAVTPSGSLDIGDGTVMVVRSLTPSGTESTVACAGNIATSGYGGTGDWPRMPRATHRTVS